jgi:hypothetical protein
VQSESVPRIASTELRKVAIQSPKFALDYWETKRLGCCCPKTVNELQFISLWADTEANRRIVMEKVGMLRFLSLLVLGGFITSAVNAQELLGFDEAGAAAQLELEADFVAPVRG